MDGETPPPPPGPAPAISPWRALAAWPPNRRVALLNRGEGADPLPRWTLLTEPESPATLPARDAAPSERDAEEVKAWLATHLPETPAAEISPIPDRPDPPWATGAVALLAYELGARLEPAAASSRAVAEAVHPDAARGDAPRWDAWIARARWSLVFDHHARRWHRAGPVPHWADAVLSGEDGDDGPAAGRLAPLRPVASDERFEAMVRRCVELVHAGDLFQANLSRAFTSVLEGAPRRLAATALADGARFGAYVESAPGEAVLSLSPELLVAVEAGGLVRSCPIKGTRPGDADLAAFAADAKDAAELAMIVDLMRNDLGRICRPGSIRVVEGRRFERHPTIVHGVAEIEGRLREDVSALDLLAAVFPAGSISGAPKIRAMQVIEDLEGERRGIYCGSVGWFDRSGDAVLNVGIRTASLRRAFVGDRWEVRYRAGCGIVADSDPVAESRESRDKTAVLARHARGVTPPDGAPSPPAVAAARRSRRRPDGSPDERARRPR